MKDQPEDNKVNKETRILIIEVADNQLTNITQFAPKNFTADALLSWWERRGERARLDNLPYSKHPFGPEKNLTGFGKLSLEAWRTGYKNAL